MSAKSSSTLSLKYLRHGVVLTGGARHEDFLFDTLQRELGENNIQFHADKKIADKIYSGLANFELLIWGFKNANATINVVVGRLAVSSIIRNLFNQSKTLIVLHNFDVMDGKGLLLKYYYKLLYSILKNSSKSKVCIIAVSPYFQEYFKKQFPNIEVFLYPNLFDTADYAKFKHEHNPRKILLGQYSSKMDSAIFRLAEMLSKGGYDCYFCTLRENEVGKFEHYEVRKFTFEEYLNEMASSYCSLSLSGVNEGWPRMVHESILVGTPVLGYNKGGLGDLLSASNSFIVKDESEAFKIITQKQAEYNTPKEFIDKYDISTAKEWLNPIINYIQS